MQKDFNNIGIAIPHLGSSQISYEAIALANQLNNAVIFFEQLIAACVPVKCASMCLSEMAAFNGILITTNVENTLMASEIINRNQTRLIFYVWDLEWLRPNKNNYLYNLQAYHTPDVLVVRHPEHVAPLANYCNRQPIVKEFEQVIQC